MTTPAHSLEPPDVAHRHTAVNGVRLHYVESGARGARPLVLLHGFPQSWLIWRLVIPLLAARYHVVAVDLRGYGDSDKPQGQAGYDKGTMAADIHALTQTLDLARPLLVGHDRGARVARRYALDYPDALVGAALLDILPVEWVYDNLPPEYLARKYWHWIFHLIPDLPEQLIAGREEAYLTAIFGRTPRFLDQIHADGAWNAYLHTFQQPGAAAASLNDYRATYNVDVPRYRAERSAGARVRVPLLLLWGAGGNLAGLPVVNIWREVADDAHGYEIAGCGHYLPEQQPSVIADHLLRFADTVFEHDAG